MKTFPVPSPGKSVREWAYRLRDCLKYYWIVGGDNKYLTIKHGPTGMVISFIWELVPEDKKAFGYRIDGANVTVYAGEIQVGTNTPVAVAEKTQAVSQDYQYIGVQLTWSTGVAELMAPTTVKPVSSGGVFRTWLYFLRYENGMVSLEKRGWGGVNIILPANYGD